MGYEPLLGPAGNHIVNFPVVTGYNNTSFDLTDVPWWHTEDSNVTLTFIPDLSAESPAITEKLYPHAFKVEPGASGADKVVGQRIVLADHDYLFAGDTVSASVWVYQDADSDTISLELYGSSADADLGTTAFGTDGAGSGSLRTVSTDRVGTWELLRISGVTLGASDTYVEFRLSSGSNSDKFYFTLPMFNIGDKAIPFQVNPFYEVRKSVSSVVDTDPTNNNYNLFQLTDVHPLSFIAILQNIITFFGSGTGSDLHVRAGHSTGTGAGVNRVNITQGNASGQQSRSEFTVNLNDNQQFSWAVTANGKVSLVAISLRGYVRFAY